MQKATVTLDLENATFLAADFKVCSFKSAKRSHYDVSVFNWSHIFTFVGQSSLKTEPWNAAKTSLHELPYLHIYEWKSIVRKM